LVQKVNQLCKSSAVGCHRTCRISPARSRASNAAPGKNDVFYRYIHSKLGPCCDLHLYTIKLCLGTTHNIEIFTLFMVKLRAHCVQQNVNDFPQAMHRTNVTTSRLNKTRSSLILFSHAWSTILTSMQFSDTSSCAVTSRMSRCLISCQTSCTRIEKT
jgi:hypothetical protein